MMEPYTRVSLRMDRDTDTVFKYGQTVLNTKATGETMSHTEKESFTILMAMSMRVIGQTTRPTVRVPIFMPTVLSMSVNGRMTSNMEREKKHGRTVVNTMDIMLTLRKRAEVFMCGLMETHT